MRQGSGISTEARIKSLRMVWQMPFTRVDPGLAFEIGMVGENGKREFILSADGIRSNMPKVESLYLVCT